MMMKSLLVRRSFFHLVGCLLLLPVDSRRSLLCGGFLHITLILNRRLAKAGKRMKWLLSLCGCRLLLFCHIDLEIRNLNCFAPQCHFSVRATYIFRHSQTYMQSIEEGIYNNGRTDIRFINSSTFISSTLWLLVGDFSNTRYSLGSH